MVVTGWTFAYDGPATNGGFAVDGLNTAVHRWVRRTVAGSAGGTGENLDAQLNPFSSTVNDSSLVSTNSTFRNTIFFNRSSAVFGMDFTYQGLRNKSLLTNGFESRIQRSINGNVRWNISRLFGMSVVGDLFGAG